MRACSQCGSAMQVLLDTKYDSYFCTRCNIWLEKRCSDDQCHFCVERPEHPLQQPDEQVTISTDGRGRYERTPV